MTRPLIALALAAGTAAAEPSVLLIGGGAGIDAAQSQIESNVRWLEDLLLERGIDVQTYFALGEHPGKDIAYWDVDRPDEPARAALARIFAGVVDTRLAFRRHELRALRGSTLKDELVPALTTALENRDAADDVLIVYNGHGGLDHDDSSQNYLRLWQEQKLDVEEVDAVLDHSPEGATTRFVMAQCYSGAFQSLIYENPPVPGELEGGRCGFMSESALEQAEGCALGVDESEFRDYSTYFFAALSGTTRVGEPVDTAFVDRDGDGRPSFREAHLYALSTAHSADLPRATSEEYLTTWKPWYLEWDARIDGRSSVYWTVAEEVAGRYEWSLAPSALEARRRELIAAREAAIAERNENTAREAALQAELREALLVSWPELAHPYSPAFHDVVAARSAEILVHVRRDSRYAELVDVQTRIAELEQSAMDARRYLTQIDKIYRLKDLARLENAIALYGSADRKRDYADLVECESGGLD